MTFISTEMFSEMVAAKNKNQINSQFIKLISENYLRKEISLLTEDLGSKSK